METNCTTCKPNMIDAKSARINAGITLFLSLLFIFTSYKFAIVLLLFDFFVKVFAHPRYAPTSYFSRYIMYSFAIQPRFVFAPPKIFATKIGLFFALSVFVLYLTNLTLASFIVCGILAVFAALEAFWGFCMGCYVHSYFSRLNNSSDDERS